MKFSNNVRILPHPCLEEGNASYPSGDYAVRVKTGDGGKTMGIEHSVENAPFISELVKSGLAAYACLISIPNLGYRKIERSESTSQLLQWGSALLGEPPLLQPVIIALKDIDHEFSDVDGVHDVWHGRIIHIPKGARLARGRYMRPKLSISHLLNIVIDKEADFGTFQVKPVVEEGFYFNVHVAKDLFDFLKANRNSNIGQYRSIITHALHACFDILQRDYSKEFENELNDGDGFSSSYSNLLALADDMRDKNLIRWWEDDFSSLEASTKFCPHKPMLDNN